jgi:hypothetical protein
VRRKNFVPSSTAVLCSRHFREEDINRTSLCKVRLRENAVPSVFPAFPAHLQTVKKARKVPTQRTPPSVVVCQDVPVALMRSKLFTCVHSGSVRVGWAAALARSRRAVIGWTGPVSRQ